MEELIEKIKALETPQIIIYTLILGAVLFVGYGVFKPSEEEETKGTSTEILEFPDADNEVENYNSKLEAYQIKEEKKNELELEFDNTLFGTEDEEKTDSQYAEEKDERVLELQRQIREHEEKKKRLQQRNTSGSNVVQGGSQPVKSKEIPKTAQELEIEKLEAQQRYYQMLEESAKTGNASTSTTIQQNSNQEFRASIYRDQFILPGDRVTLVLPERVEFNGYVFPKNTILYATANIQKSRVLLNIDKINHKRVSVEARDIDDGGVGLYSKRAGELWTEFQGNIESNGSQDIGQDISRSANVPLVGSAVRAFSNFFRKKRYKERDKILLVNDHQVILIQQIPQ